MKSDFGYYIVVMAFNASAHGFQWNRHFKNSFFQCMSVEYFSLFLFLQFLYQCFLVFRLLVCSVLLLLDDLFVLMQLEMAFS